MWVATLFIVPHRELRKTIFLISPGIKLSSPYAAKVCVCVEEGEQYIGVSYSISNTLILSLILLTGVYFIFLNKYFFMCVFLLIFGIYNFHQFEWMLLLEMVWQTSPAIILEVSSPQYFLWTQALKLPVDKRQCCHFYFQLYLPFLSLSLFPPLITRAGVCKQC